MLSKESVKKVQVICPICNFKEIVILPTKIIRNASHLTTISIPKGKVCEHHFQIFIDKAFNIRGYQKVDFELESRNSLLQQNNSIFTNGLDVYEKKFDKKPSFSTSKLINTDSKNDRILRKIYDEFWEFIDDDNEQFQKFILKDKRRKQTLSVLGELKNYKNQFMEILQKAN